MGGDVTFLGLWAALFVGCVLAVDAYLFVRLREERTRTKILLEQRNALSVEVDGLRSELRKLAGVDYRTAPPAPVRRLPRPAPAAGPGKLTHLTDQQLQEMAKNPEATAAGLSIVAMGLLLMDRMRNRSRRRL